jgi:hypothetical protein
MTDALAAVMFAIARRGADPARDGTRPSCRRTVGV